MDPQEPFSDKPVANQPPHHPSPMINPATLFSLGLANDLPLDEQEKVVEQVPGILPSQSPPRDNNRLPGVVVRSESSANDDFFKLVNAMTKTDQTAEKGDDKLFCDWIEGVFSDDESVTDDAMDVETEQDAVVENTADEDMQHNTTSTTQKEYEPIQKEVWEAYAVVPGHGPGYGRADKLQRDRGDPEAIQLHREELGAGSARGELVEKQVAILPQLQDNLDISLVLRDLQEKSRDARASRKLVMLDCPALLQMIGEINYKARKNNEEAQREFEAAEAERQQQEYHRLMRQERQNSRTASQRTSSNAPSKPQPVKRQPANSFIVRTPEGQVRIISQPKVVGRIFNDKDPLLAAPGAAPIILAPRLNEDSNRTPTMADFASLAERLEKTVDVYQVFCLHEQWYNVLQYIQKLQPYIFGFESLDIDTIVVFTASCKTLELRFLRVDKDDIQRYITFQTVQQRCRRNDVNIPPPLLRTESSCGYIVDISSPWLAINQIRPAKSDRQIVPEMFKNDFFPEDTDVEEECTFCLFECDYGVFEERFWADADTAHGYCVDCYGETMTFDYPWCLIAQNRLVACGSQVSHEGIQDPMEGWKEFSISKTEYNRYSEQNYNPALKEFKDMENRAKRLEDRQAAATSGSHGDGDRVVDLDGMDLDSTRMSDVLFSNGLGPEHQVQPLENPGVQDHTSGDRRTQPTASQYGGIPNRRFEGTHGQHESHALYENYNKSPEGIELGRRNQLRQQAAVNGMKTGHQQQLINANDTNNALVNERRLSAQGFIQQPTDARGIDPGDDSLYLRGEVGEAAPVEKPSDFEKVNSQLKETPKQTAALPVSSGKTSQPQMIKLKTPKANDYGTPVFSQPLSKQVQIKARPAPTIKHETTNEEQGQKQIIAGDATVSGDKNKATPVRKQSYSVQSEDTDKPIVPEGMIVGFTQTIPGPRAGSCASVKQTPKAVVIANHPASFYAAPVVASAKQAKSAGTNKSAAIPNTRPKASANGSASTSGRKRALSSVSTSNAPPSKKAKGNAAGESSSLTNTVAANSEVIIPAPPVLEGFTRQQLDDMIRNSVKGAQSDTPSTSKNASNIDKVRTMTLAPDQLERFQLVTESYRKRFGALYEEQQQKFRAEGRRVIAPAWNGLDVGVQPPASKVHRIDSGFQSGSEPLNPPSVMPGRDQSKTLSQSPTRPRSGKFSPSPRRQISGTAWSTPSATDQRQASLPNKLPASPGSSVTSTPRSGTFNRENHPRLPQVPTFSNSNEFQDWPGVYNAPRAVSPKPIDGSVLASSNGLSPKMLTGGFSATLPTRSSSLPNSRPAYNLQYGGPDDGVLSQQGSIQELQSMGVHIHTVLDNPIACISPYSDYHERVLKEGVLMGDIELPIAPDFDDNIWRIDSVDSPSMGENKGSRIDGSSPQSSRSVSPSVDGQNTRAPVEPPMVTFAAPKSADVPPLRRKVVPRIPDLPPTPKPMVGQRAPSGSVLQPPQRLPGVLLERRESQVRDPNNLKRPSKLRQVVAPPPSPSPPLPAPSPHPDYTSHMPQGNKFSPLRKSSSQSSRSHSQKHSHASADTIERVEGIITCRGCQWGQLDVTKICICTKCKDTKCAIIQHRHEEFISLIPLDDVESKPNGYFEDDNLKTNITGKKLRACMICTSRALWVCKDCPFRACEGCKVRMEGWTKGKISELLMMMDREHVRNDAFLLRGDGKGF